LLGLNTEAQEQNKISLAPTPETLADKNQVEGGGVSWGEELLGDF
jgi:hypothetical protein